MILVGLWKADGRTWGLGDDCRAVDAARRTSIGPLVNVGDLRLSARLHVVQLRMRREDPESRNKMKNAIDSKRWTDCSPNPSLRRAMAAADGKDAPTGRHRRRASGLARQVSREVDWGASRMKMGKSLRTESEGLGTGVP